MSEIVKDAKYASLEEKMNIIAESVSETSRLNIRIPNMVSEYTKTLKGSDSTITDYVLDLIYRDKNFVDYIKCNFLTLDEILFLLDNVEDKWSLFNLFNLTGKEFSNKLSSIIFHGSKANVNRFSDVLNIVCEDYRESILSHLKSMLDNFYGEISNR